MSIYQKGTDHTKLFINLKINHLAGGTGGLTLIFCPCFLIVSRPCSQGLAEYISYVKKQPAKIRCKPVFMG
jgi:hypothetical protein